MLVAAARDRLSSFSAFARVEFDGLVLWRAVGSLGHASVGRMARRRLSRCRVMALVTGWLRACYLIALGEGHYSIRAPWVIVSRLTVYSLAIELIGLVLAGLFDNGQGMLGLIVLLATTPVTLYADYAIVFDDVGVGGGRAAQPSRVPAAAARVDPRRARAHPALGVRGARVQERLHRLDARAAELPRSRGCSSGVLLQFVTDAVLLTLYRGTRLSEAVPAGSSEAPRSSEAFGLSARGARC